MRQLISVLIAILASAVSIAADFDQFFDDATLRLDVCFVPHGPQRGLTIGSITQWEGWSGRRVNLDRPLYNDALTVTVTDCVCGDTLYVESKYRTFEVVQEPGKGAWSVLLIPRPKVPVKVEVHDGVETPKGMHRGASTSITIDPIELPSIPTVRASTPYLTLRKAIDPESSVNLAIVAEGFTPERMWRFIAKACYIDSALFTRPGFKEMADRFNVIAVMLPSSECGVSRPSQGKVVDTALRSHFDSFSLDRLVTIPDPRPLWDALAGLPAQQIMILADTDAYGGSGPYNEYAIASAGDPNWDSIIVHEFGHTFANLGDEYESGGYEDYYSSKIEPVEPNITTMCNFESKWKDLVDSGEASLIEGAGYQEKGVWRAYPECLMRQLADVHFCPVCTRAIRKTIEFYTESASR